VKDTIKYSTPLLCKKLALSTKAATVFSSTMKRQYYAVIQNTNIKNARLIQSTMYLNAILKVNLI
jgi:hypothetical protein